MSVTALSEGELEAHVRGSRWAWDARLASLRQMLSISFSNSSANSGSLRQADSAEQVVKTRVAAQRIKERVYFQELENV